MLRLFPDGALSLLEATSESVDAEMEKRLAKLKLAAMPLRGRIAAAVITQLAILKPHKEAVRRAAAHLSLPTNVALGAKLVYRTVDAMWRAAGDVSTDFNFYTKRAILAGVYTATLLHWLADDGADESATDAFLAARIENVMQFEKLKAQVKEQARKLPSFVGGRFGNRIGLFLAPRREPRGKRLVRKRQDGHGMQRRVFGARFADGEGRNRHAARHLDDGQETVEAFERLGFHGHTEHRQSRHRGRHPRQMRRASGRRDDHLQAALRCRLGIGDGAVRRAVRRDDLALIGHAQRL
jgi:ubiquinone biosynthesis protein COQ9